jgi:drug/metabolite transporter (DMT)-like permease
MNDQSRGLLITTIGVLFVVPDALFIRMIEAPILTIIFWRCLLQGVVVLAVMLFYYRSQLPNKIRVLGRSGITYAIFSAIAGICFALSINTTSVANTVFIIASMPVFAAIISWFTLGEVISRRMIWTIGFAMIGIGVIAYGSFEEGTNSSPIGDLAAVGTAVFFSIALTSARKVKQHSMLPMVPITFIGAALIILPFCDPFDVAPGHWGWVLIHGGFFIAISTCGLALGPRYITSAEVTLLILLESILSPLLVWWVLAEEPTSYALIGGVIVLATLLLSNLIVLMRPKVRNTKSV